MDRIKKIKVKKSDGSFTDYLPIGSDAEYVDTSDDLSVQEHLDLLNNNKIKCYTSVAQMKSDNRLKVGDTAQTLGYYEAKDGGGGLYLIKNDSSLVDDGGSVHDLTNGLKAELIINDSVNVKQFGAYGDNIHDDSNSIRVCINKVNNIILTDGVYKINIPINLNELNNKNLTGYNAIINIDNNTYGLKWELCNNISIENIKFTSEVHKNLENRNTSVNIINSFINCNNITINKTIWNKGCMGCNFINCSDIIYSNNINSEFSWGIYIGGDRGLLGTITRCKIFNNIGFNNINDGLKLTGYIRDIEIFNNECYSNMRDGIDFAGETANNIKIYHNNLYNNIECGIDFKVLDRKTYPFDETKTKEFENIFIYDNNIIENGTYGINSQLYYEDINVQEYIIKNNNIVLSSDSSNPRKFSSAGIRLVPIVTSISNAIHVLNNYIDCNNEGFYGIRLENAENIVVKENYIHNFTGNGIKFGQINEFFDNYNATCNNLLIEDNIILYNGSSNVTCIQSTGSGATNNLIIRNNKIRSNLNTWVIEVNLYDDENNIIYGNEMYDSFDTIPTGRSQIGLIFRSSNPINTSCTGWIGKINNSNGEFIVYESINLN